MQGLIQDFFRVYCNSISNSKRSVNFLNPYSRTPVAYFYIGLLQEVGEAGFALKYAPTHQENKKIQNHQDFSHTKQHHSIFALGLT